MGHCFNHLVHQPGPFDYTFKMCAGSSGTSHRIKSGTAPIPDFTMWLVPEHLLVFVLWEMWVQLPFSTQCCVFQNKKPTISRGKSSSSGRNAILTTTIFKYFVNGEINQLNKKEAKPTKTKHVNQLFYLFYGKTALWPNS